MTDTDPKPLMDRLLAQVARAGADAADLLYVRQTADSAQVRLGEVENTERAQSEELGLRVLVGRRQAAIATSRMDDASLDDAADRAVAMAKAAPEDPYTGLADRPGPAPSARLDLDDGGDWQAADLTEAARVAEAAARAVPGVTNSEGGHASATRTQVALATSTGFYGTYAGTRYGVSAVVLAGETSGMVRDYDYARRRHRADLPDPETIGRCAGERAVRRLGAQKPGSASLPVIFDRRVAKTLLGHLSQAVSGPAVARGTSFLKERKGERLFREGIRIIDDPTLKKGLGSRPFDGETLPVSSLALIDDGVLTSWLLNLASARQLDLPPTGHASRGLSGPPGVSTSNFYLEAGDVTPDALIAQIDRGLYVTELMGMGVNPVTGDYSRGAAGFLIEQGRLSTPVHELTIASNLIDMFSRLTPANDLVLDEPMAAPTVLIDTMTVAGA
ncbi:MAG: TldD/PmbA family protein [Rhodothalassiaceae bacterium]